MCSGATVPTGSRVDGDGTWPEEGCNITGDTCNAIKLAFPSAEDGVYSIDPDGTGGMEPFDAYCNMTDDNGGWVLIGSTTNTSISGWNVNTTAIGTVTTPGNDPNTRFSAARVQEILDAGVGELATQGTGINTFSKFRLTNNEPFGWHKNYSGNWQYSSDQTTTWFNPPANRMTLAMAPQHPSSHCYTGNTAVGPYFVPLMYAGNANHLYAIRTGVCTGVSAGSIYIWAR